MQRIEFLNSLKEITERLKSHEIAEIFRQGFNQPNNTYDYGRIKPLLFESKSQFDQIMKEPKLANFLNKISGIGIYDEKTLSILATVLHQTKALQLLANSTITNFYSFHSSMIDLLNISTELLSNDYIKKSHEENLNSGVVLFQVSIDSEGLATSTYIKIFSALDDLVKTLEKATKVDESEPEIVLLDSGSDTNIGLETKVEIAKSIFQIFKEIWDFITSLRFYRTQQRNQTLLESLTIRKEILKSVKEGILTEDEGKEYIHIIKTRTDELIGMKVLPRALSDTESIIDNNKILEEYKIKILQEKN